MTPNSSRSQTPPTPASHRRAIHDSALPLLGTMTTTLALAIVIIVLTISGIPDSLMAAYLP